MPRKRKYVMGMAGGSDTHPTTGEQAPEGMQWVRHALTGQYVLEPKGTPYVCSVSSETYWCS